VDANGKPRQLHVKEALATMNLSIPPPVPSESAACKYFSFRKIPAGVISPSSSRRIIYDPSKDLIWAVEPGGESLLDNSAFEISL
jgi:hypothetical protein